MARILERKYARDLYIPWLQELADNGDKVDVRGRQTYEILDAVSVITEPWHHCILIPSRRWNPFLALSEALWILAGRNDVAGLKPYNSHISDYSDDGSTLYGAYGRRIAPQIDPLIDRLKTDPNDRRAVLGIWDPFGGSDLAIDPWSDLTMDTKDPPCNNLLYFKLRNNQLHMTVVCRSNDIHFGLFGVNIPTFGILQEYIAARLGVDIGTQTHLSNSLHVYTDDKRATQITYRMIISDDERYPKYPQHYLMFDEFIVDHYPSFFKTHETFGEICGDILDGRNVEIGPSLLPFASRFLKQYREHDWHPNNFFPTERERFADWIEAGDIFVREVWK